MKKLFCIGYLIWMVLPLQAQKFLLSEKEEFNIRRDDFGVIGQFDKYIAVYRRHDEHSEIILYNKLFQKEKVVPLGFIEENLNEVSFSTDGREICIFFQLKEQKLLTLSASKLTQDLNLSSPKILMSIPINQFRLQQGYRIVHSENKSKHLVYADIRTETSLALQASVLDNEFNEINHIDQLFDQPELYISDMAEISNEGTSFLLFSEKLTPRRMMDHAQLYACNLGAHEFSKYTINLEGKFLSDAQLLYDNSNQLLYLFGYFADGKYNAPRGIFISRYNKNETISTNNHFVPITLQVSNGRSDLQNMKIRYTSLKKNGGLEMATENFYQQVRSISSYNPSMNNAFMSMPETSRTVNEFNYEEIAIFNFKLDGSLAWSQTILKDQQTTDDNGIFSSFGVMEHPKGKAYIFNDLNTSNTRFMASYVSAQGLVTLKEFQSTEEMNTWDIMPRSAVQISSTEIVMPCVTKSYLCFLKIDFN